jgi:hypothetical protein
MLTSEVDFTVPVFHENPAGWRSADDLVNGFVLAWSLEERERRRIDPSNPFGQHVRNLLPPEFRNDTLGKLIPMPSSAREQASTMPGRLTTLCIVWRLFENLSQQWQLRPGDEYRFSRALAFVTGDTEQPSLFEDLSANLAKCLLSDRFFRAHQTNETLTQSEEWFVTGSSEFLIDGEVIPLFVARQPIFLPQFPEDFALSVWSVARILVEIKSPEYYISAFSHQIPTLVDVLKRGAVLAEQRKLLLPIQALNFELWPGWPSER